jgi:hypothetical protein
VLELRTQVVNSRSKVHGHYTWREKSNVVVHRNNIEGNLKCQKSNYNSGINEAYDMKVVIYILNKIFIKIRYGDQVCPSFTFVHQIISTHSFIHPCTVSSVNIITYFLFDSCKKNACHSQIQAVTIFFVFYIQENGFVWEKHWPAWNCFYS